MGLSVLSRFFDYLGEIDLDKILINQIVETDLDIILNLVTMEQTNAYGNSCRRRLRVVSENEENEPGSQSVAKVLLERKQQSRSLKRLLDQTNEGEVFATPVQLSNGASYPPTAPRKVRKLQTKETAWRQVTAVAIRRGLGFTNNCTDGRSVETEIPYGGDETLPWYADEEENSRVRGTAEMTRRTVSLLTRKPIEGPQGGPPLKAL